MNLMKNIKYVIFDFDGTIADTMPYSFGKSLELLRKEKIDTPEKQIIKKIRSSNYIELMKEFKLSWLKIPFILRIIEQTQKDLYFYIEKIRIFPGMKKFLFDLKKERYKLAIISSNRKENIDKFIKFNKLDIFDFVHGKTDLFGKAVYLKKFLKDFNLKKSEVIYIGDEIRDVESCKKVGIKMIGVSWGLHKVEALKKNGVDYIVKKPLEILQIIKN